MANVSIDDLADAIVSAVRDYTEDVSEGIEREVDETAEHVQKTISADSPRKSGEYAKGWTRKKISSGGVVRNIIYNKNKPRIAHLLEFGHVKRGGGRVSGKPHIRPPYDREVPRMEERIRAIIRNGG